MCSWGRMSLRGGRDVGAAAGHVDVQDQQVGSGLLDLFQAADAVVGLPDDGEAWIPRQDLDDRLAEFGLVVADHDAAHPGCMPGSRGRSGVGTRAAVIAATFGCSSSHRPSRAASCRTSSDRWFRGDRPVRWAT